MKQISAVEWLKEHYYLEIRVNGEIHIDLLNKFFEQAKEMENNMATEYAEFCIRCDRAGLTYPKIAKQFNVSQQRIALICKQYKIEMVKTPDAIFQFHDVPYSTPKLDS